MARVTLPENFKIVELLSNVTDGSARTGDWVSLKNCHRCTIVCSVLGGAATAMDINPQQASDVAGTGAKVFTNTLPIWSNSDTSATDTLVRQTDAVDANTAASAVNQMVIFQIDPEKLDVPNGFDCVTVVTEGDSASNLLSVVAICETRYPSATPPTQITD